MPNKISILNKLARDLEQLGYSPVRSAYAVTLSNCIVRYSDNTMSGPMGGVSDANAPYLGLGAGNPGVLQISGLLDADAALTDIFAAEADLVVLRLCSQYANDVQVVAGDTASVAATIGAGAQLAYLPSDANLRVLGQ